jgi:predicted dehydrogenase
MHGRDGFNITLLGSRMGAEMYPLQLYYDDVGTMMTTSPQVSPPTESLHYVETQLFIEAIREGKPVPMPGEQSLVTMKILDAIYASAQSGREVPITWEEGESWTW